MTTKQIPQTPREAIEMCGKTVNIWCRCAPNGTASGQPRVSQGKKAVVTNPATGETKTVMHCPACGRYWWGGKKR